MSRRDVARPCPHAVVRARAGLDAAPWWPRGEGKADGARALDWMAR
jgi:hypothetical protein